MEERDDVNAVLEMAGLRGHRASTAALYLGSLKPADKAALLAFVGIRFNELLELRRTSAGPIGAGRRPRAVTLKQRAR